MMQSESDKVALLKELDAWANGEAISETSKGQIVGVLLEKINSLERRSEW